MAPATVLNCCLGVVVPLSFARDPELLGTPSRVVGPAFQPVVDLDACPLARSTTRALPGETGSRRKLLTPIHVEHTADGVADDGLERVRLERFQLVHMRAVLGLERSRPARGFLDRQW